MSSESNPSKPLQLIPSTDSSISAWKKVHEEWTQGSQESKSKKQHVNIDSVLKTMSSQEETTFEKPVPLGALVEILIETWEGEGSFD
jgi:hypothetical protein